MRLSTKLDDLSMLALSAVLGAGSIVLFASLRSLHLVPMHWPDSMALPWDALLSLAFFLQHSGMIRGPARARLAAIVPVRYQAAAYAIASGIVLTLVVVLWQHSDTRVLALGGIARWLAQALSIVAAATFVFTAYTLRRAFDPLGIGPIRAHLRNRAYRPPDIIVRGPYLWVRHPLYSCILMLFWSNADVNADQLLLSVLWTLWIWLGAVLEERGLVADFGDAYRAYQRQVPMLIPWHGRVTLAKEGAGQA